MIVVHIPDNFLLVDRLRRKVGVRSKRITATEKPVDNEKYAFRCFLLRLGFIGSEHKTQRKILLRNLTGSSAFRSGTKKEVADDAVSE